MAIRTRTPQQQIDLAVDAAAHFQVRLEAEGLPVRLLEQWLNQMLYLRKLRAQQAAGALETLTWDDEDEND